MSFGRSRATGGVAGAQGFQGNDGAVGPQGNQGFQGVAGAGGAAGPQGNQGFQGDSGAVGAAGPQGNQGFQGNDGAAGPQGNQGFQGAGGAPPFSDATAILADNITDTKLLRFELVGLPVGTTVITPPGVDITLPGVNIANTWAATQTFSVPIVAALGTASLPGIAFAGFLDSGFYGRGDGSIGIAVSGLEKLFISSSGLILQSALLWNNDSLFNATDEGKFLLAGGGTFEFSWLYLGGLTAAFPAIKRNATAIEFKLADDSAFANIKALGITLTAGAGLNKVLTSDANGVATWETSGAGSSPPFADTTAIIKGSDLDTKLLKFELDGWAGAVTRTITPPDADITLAGQNFANVFTAAQTINAGTVTVSTPVLDLAQTWNAAGVTFTGLKLNVTSTASAAASLLMDLQVGGASKLSISKAGFIYASNGSTSGPAYSFASSGNSGMWWNGGTLFLTLAGVDTFTVGPNYVHINSNSTALMMGTALDVALHRDAAGIMGLRNGTNAQTFRIYNTSDVGVANYERSFLGWTSNVFTIGTDKLGTGVARDIQFLRDGTLAMTIGAAGLVSGALLAFSGTGHAGLKLNNLSTANESALTGAAGMLIWNTDKTIARYYDGTAWRTLSGVEVLGYAVGDETTAITTGTAKLTFRMPFAMTLIAVRASLTTASSSGIPTFDINMTGTGTILSTKLTVDASEKTSTTAAAAAVIGTAALTDDAEMTVDIDVAGTGATGPKIWLIGYRT